MMTRIYIFLLLISSAQISNAQIAMDSLMSELNMNFSVEGTKSYLMENFTCFESKNGKDRFDVCLDSLDQLQEYIGLSVVHYSFDDANRLTLIEGFNRSGQRSYWDFPAVTTFTYINDTLVTDMNRLIREACKCELTSVLSNVMIEKEFYLSSDSVYNRTRYFVTSQDSLFKLRFTKNLNHRICRQDDNSYYILRQFDSAKSRNIVQERYYDEKLKLVNGAHEVYINESFSQSAPNQPYAYSLRHLSNGKISAFEFYDKKGRLVEKREEINFGGPVNVPY